MKSIKKTHAIPKNSVISRGFGDYHYCDSFSVITQYNNSLDSIITTIFQTPKWADLLMGIRNVMFSLTGLDKGGFKEKVHIAHHYPIGSKAVYFTVIDRNENEIVTAENDKHLNFRISVMKNKQETNDTIHLTTLVKYNNFLGRFYFFIIKPFHRRIIMSLMKRLISKHENVKM